ncbi:GNAT family N-acetyltransferase [Protaetiibacter mangrovi]|uniref:GNAT family N-acetyltransferase n=1 Tax=Protaetiibacter mangrovi TaxID=2970926 RepID=A0ABT1ZC11_9MICO|nr:GNAT family N-acetyltransferase [Protaetiibacter mangrovi]MCS0498239.1 GNAT family N-acetyltransferase [Protaetiibacter mangrovi]
MAPLPDRDELLALFDADERALEPRVAEGRPYEFDGPLMRIEFRAAGLVRAPADLGVDGPPLEALIRRQVEHFAARGLPLEWKTYAGDRPDSLVPLLLASGFEPGPIEAIMVAASAELAAAAPPPGVTVRDADADEFAAIAGLLGEVWSTDHGWVAAELATLRETHGDGLRVLVAESGGELVSAAWTTMRPGERFAGLWGGSTRPDHRRRGIYRALVAARASVAHAQGVPFLRVDASEMSRPVLEALGFIQLTTTTPYVWSP